ncbi:MAG TPA: flagellar hook basal-body protein, partial [Candidatus Omnitrophota bacterium]|nr:flagellar hook basal-body protein [Candidatus Omnitrophota bacterium]
GTFYNHTKGSMIPTGNQTDFALGSDGFFVISCPWGEGYTRDGRFVVDSEGNIVSTVNHYPLLGQNGPIAVPPGTPIELNQSGEIMANGAVIDRIRVVNFQALDQLDSINGAIFRNTDQKQTPQEVDTPRIVQGYVEASNADEVDQMMDLVLLNRVYNMNTKIVTVWDADTTKAIEMGKVQ